VQVVVDTATPSSAAPPTRVSGLYTLGLAYQDRRNSHFIGGVDRRAWRAQALMPAVAA
jgi:hypothetical protein